MGKVQRKRKNRAYVQELLGRIGNGFLENGNEEHTNEFSFQANDGETETENWDPTEYEVQSDEHAEYLQTEEPLFEDEKDPRDIERIAALLHVTQLLYPLNLSPQKLCMVFECAKYIVQFGLNSKEISDSAESLYNEFCDPKTNTYCSLCYNELVGGVCEKKECILFRKKTVRGSSSETTIVTSYQIRQQVTKVLSRQLPEVLETHRFHHNLNQNHLTYTDLSSFHISMKYGANIERFQDFNQKRLILPVSISHDGFRPTNHSKSELTPLYLRIEGVKKQVKEAADSIILCAIMSGPKGVCKGNAGLFAARLCNELEDIRNDNIRLSIDGEVWNVQLQVTMTILDLKASHCSSGWPNWLNIRGCSYCKIKGKKEGRGAVSFYSESRQQPRTRNELVEDMRNTSFINNLTILASPYDNSIDELHVCSEGIFKRILTDMLGITSHSPALKLSKAQIAGIDKCVSNLRSHTDYRSNFVTFSKLGKLSGTQIRQLSRVVFALGAHANLYGSLEVRLLLVSLLQLFDLSMSIKNAADLPKLNYIAHMVKYFLYKKDPMDFSLKTHIFVDHVEQKISEDGNLSGTSTAPFEKNHRLLSINYDQHSTSMADLGRRFLAAQALRDHNIKASEGEIRLNSTVSVRSNYLIVCEETVRQLKTMIPAHRCPDKFWKRVIMADGQVLSSKQWRRKNSIEELSVSMSSPSGFVYGYPLAFFEENSEMFVLMKKFTVQDPTVELLSEASRHVFQKDLVDGFAHLTTTTSCLLPVMYQEYEEYGEDQLHTSGPIVPNKTGFLRQRVVGAGVANSSGFESARNNRCYIPVDQSQILPQRYEPYQRPVLTTPRAASRPPAPVISAPQPRPVENELEKAFSMEIDVNRPLLSNLMTAIQKHRTQEFQIDINKAGVVLSKYHREGVLDRMSLHVAEEALGRGSLRVTVASDLGVVSRSAYQFGNNLMLNILAKKMSSTEPPSSKSSEFHFRHQFQFVTMQFNGSYPFKTSAIVTTRNCMKSVDDPQRSMSRVIRVVLLQILDDPRGHQNFALRQEEASNSKTPLVDLPDEVFLFLERFCFETYGLFPRLRHPGYSYQDLRRESLSLAAILGRTEEEGESKFNLLLKDADAFAQVVFLKVQRTLNDLRKKIAQHPRRDDNGHFNGKFVADPAVEAIHTAGSAAGSTDRSEEYRNSESPDQQNEVEC